MVTWELRYRSPRTLDNVQIETYTDNEAEAKELADAYLATLNSPAIRFVYVRQIIVARSCAYADIANKWRPKDVDGEPPWYPSAKGKAPSKSMASGAEGPGRVGA